MKFEITSEETSKKVSQIVSFKDFKEGEVIILSCSASMSPLAIPIAHSLHAVKELKYTKVDYNGDEDKMTI